MNDIKIKKKSIKESNWIGNQTTNIHTHKTSKSNFKTSSGHHHGEVSSSKFKQNVGTGYGNDTFTSYFLRKGKLKLFL